MLFDTGGNKDIYIYTIFWASRYFFIAQEYLSGTSCYSQLRKISQPQELFQGQKKIYYQKCSRKRRKRKTCGGSKQTAVVSDGDSM